MVYNTFLRCQVCGSITRIRHQIGWLESHPIFVGCGNCKTSLEGVVYQNQDKPGLYYSFQNANVIEETDADYVIECSGEFIVEKLKEDKGILSNPISPYFRFVGNTINDESYNDFCKDIAVLNETVANWSTYKRILDLYINKQTDYLISELYKLFPQPIIPIENDFGLLQCLHLIEIHGFDSVLCKDILENSRFYTDLIIRNDRVQLKELINYLDNNPGYSLEDLQASIYRLLDRFIKVYPNLIPAYSLNYLKAGSVDYVREGTTTSDYYAIKPFILSLYETLGDLMIVPIALNNLSCRDNYDCLNNSIIGDKTLEDFIKMSKANRYKYCLASEPYTQKLHLVQLSKLRNAIGHEDIIYDPVSQIITYAPDKNRKDKKNSLYLLEAEEEIIKMFQDVLMISEYLYHLRKYSYIIKDSNLTVN